MSAGSVPPDVAAAMAQLQLPCTADGILASALGMSEEDLPPADTSDATGTHAAPPFSRHLSQRRRGASGHAGASGEQDTNRNAVHGDAEQRNQNGASEQRVRSGEGGGGNAVAEPCCHSKELPLFFVPGVTLVAPVQVSCQRHLTFMFQVLLTTLTA